tara:strand:- start:1706 stop:2038 length:333 start_codon:yes stop_codon:yes gene_type:complete
MSSKFLKLIEENNPERGNYKIILQASSGEVIDSVDISGTEFAWDIFSNIKNTVHPEEEQESDIEKTAKTAAAVLSIPDQGFKPFTAAGKVQKAKKILAKKLVKAADNIEI